MYCLKQDFEEKFHTLKKINQIFLEIIIHLPKYLLTLDYINII